MGLGQQTEFLVLYQDEISSGVMGIAIVTDKKTFQSVQVNSTLISSNSSLYYLPDHANVNCTIGTLISTLFGFEKFTFNQDIKFNVLLTVFINSLCPMSSYNITFMTIDSSPNTLNGDVIFNSG